MEIFNLVAFASSNLHSTAEEAAKLDGSPPLLAMIFSIRAQPSTLENYSEQL